MNISDSAHTSGPSPRPPAATLEFRAATKRYPGAGRAGGRGALARGSGRGDLRAGRPLGLRQDHRDADGEPHDRHHRRATSCSTARACSERRPAELRREIGYAIQQIGLFPHLTVADNIATVPRLLGWDRERIRARVDELLELVSLDPAETRDRYPAQLSGGQRQRVGRGPGARGRPAADADGRALRRDRPDQPRAAPERVPAPPAARSARRSCS